MRWKPVIVRQSPDYMCPFCGSSAGTIMLGKYCDNCGSKLDNTMRFADDFKYIDGKYYARVETGKGKNHE